MAKEITGKSKIPAKKGRENSVRYSRALAEEICEFISQNIAVAELYRRDPKKYPRPETFTRWISKHEDLKEMYFESRKVQMTILHDLYTDLLNNPPKYTGDKFFDSHERDVWKRRVSALEYELSKIAPIFDQRYHKTEKMHIEGDNLGPQIMIASYAMTEDDYSKILQRDDWKGIDEKSEEE